MTTNIARYPVQERDELLSEVAGRQDSEQESLPAGAPDRRRDQLDLPTFPLEVGWREVLDPVTGKLLQTPLTLRDLLFPNEDDIGVVFMAQSLPHSEWIRWLTSMLEAYLRNQNWVFLNDVLIHWGYQGIDAKAPDIAAIPGSRKPPRGANSYRVGRDGPLPAFVVEITSEATRAIDLEFKPIFYASVGVKELLLIDTLPHTAATWRLAGYRLVDDPYYNLIEPDAQGGLTFESVGLRFVAVGYAEVEVYDAATGERLATPATLKERADAAEERAEVAEGRAEVEAAAREVAEAELARVKAELAQLRGSNV